MATMKRGFVDVPHGQIHYRIGGSAGSTTPLAMIHPSPGSSRQIADLAGHLADRRLVVAPDTAVIVSTAPAELVTASTPAGTPQPAGDKPDAPLPVNGISKFRRKPR